MRMKRIAAVFLACLALAGTLCASAGAANLEEDFFKVKTEISPRASGSFNMSIPARTKAVADSDFPLAAGETVTIKASYSPFSASVDFGLVAPDGKFYYFNVTDGSIDETIEVDESGNYTLQVRNNSGVTVRVSGFVNY